MNEADIPQRSPKVGYHSLLTLAALVVVIAGLKAASSIIVPVLLAAFLAVLSFPPMRALHRRGLPKWAAFIVVFLGVIVAMVAISAILTNSVRDLTENIPTYQQHIQDQLTPLLAWAAGYGVQLSATELAENLSAQSAMSYLAVGLGAISSMLSNTFFVLLTMVFIIAEAAGFESKIRIAIGSPSADLSRYSKVLDDLQAYLGIKTMVSLVTGLLAGLLCYFAGVDFPLLWALLAFLLNYIPTLGSIIAAAPPVLFLLIELGWKRALIVAIGYVAINLIMGNVIEPRLMGRRLGLSTLVVFLSLVFWGFVWGPLGMLLCIPLTMIVKILLENSDDLKWVAVLLGSAAELRERRSSLAPDRPKGEEAPPSQSPQPD